LAWLLYIKKTLFPVEFICHAVSHYTIVGLQNNVIRFNWPNLIHAHYLTVTTFCHASC